MATATVIQGNILSSPSLAPDGTIYIGTEVGSSTSTSPGGRLLAVSPAGAVKWSFTAPEWIDSTPAVAPDGTVYVGCWDGNLYAFRPDGTTKWTCPLGSFVSASPAIGADGTVYIGTGSGNLYAVAPDGTVRWFYPTLYWIEAAPAIAPDGTIYVGSDDNSLYSIRPDGTLNWRFAAGNDIASSPAIAADGTVYFGCRDLKLYAMTPAGTLKWSVETTDMIDASPVLSADGTVYAATTGGRLLAFRHDGTMKWQYPASGQTALGSIYSTPVVRAEGSIVFGSSDNALVAVRADGTLLWKSTVGDWIDSSAVVAPDGTVYVGCTDKNLYAFHGTSGVAMTDWPQLLRDSQRTGRQPLGSAFGTTGRLSNLSVRTAAGSGDATLIVGFSVGGSGTRTLLVRGVGPTLAGYGVTEPLSDPSIAVFPSGSSVVSLRNDSWEQNVNAAAISSAAATLGAFPLPSGSLDAALYSGFPAGGQTVQVTGPTAASGIALLELYDAGGSEAARLTNVSARSSIGTGAGVLIAGFIVSGDTRAVLIRGIGPTLAGFGVSGVLTNPQLRVYNAQQMVVAENDDWSTATNAAALATAAKAVGAFDLTTGSRDAVMLLTLPQGSYTVQMSGVGGTTGIGLIEVYELR